MSEPATPAPQDILFHVGYHKTATSWMQREFFQARAGFHQVLSPDQVAMLITDPLVFDFDADAVRRVIDAQLDSSGLANVVSNETLCGHPFYGGREGPVFARRIQAVAPHARILFTIREQKRAIVSTYMQYISRGGSLSPDKFFEKSSEKYAYYNFNVRHFLYDRLVTEYIEMFGRERVLVVTMESFVRSPAAMLGTIARFAGADPSAVASTLTSRRVGESPVEAVAPILRRINHFRPGPAKREVVLDLGGLSDWLYRAVHRLGRHSGVKARLREVTPVSSAVRERFRGAFGESNWRLQDALESMLDLSADGYEMAGHALACPRPSALADAPVDAAARSDHEPLVADRRDRALPPG